MKRTILLGFLAAGTLLPQLVILQGPVVDSITYSSARVTWITNQPADTILRYGLNTLDAETTDSQVSTTHSWFISGLAPGTTYTYKACSRAGGSEICSPENMFTTQEGTGAPQLPEPPRQTVDTSLPTGGFGEPFIVDQSCSNLPEVLRLVAALEGESNYEIRIPPLASCMGQTVFPARPNHRGWVIVKTTGSLPPEGVRAGPGDTAQMARFITDALPGLRLSTISFPTTCSPGSLIWGNGVPGMALFICSHQGDSGGAKAITSFATIDSVVVLGVPGHGYQTGNIVRVAGSSTVDGGWRITVLDQDRISLDGARSSRSYSGAGTVARNDAWNLVPHRSGSEFPADCTANDWFLWTDRPPAEGLFWCTSANTWTPVRPGNYVLSEHFAAIQFAENASRYRFVGIEVTQINMPNPPPSEWSLRDHKQGNIGALVATKQSNDRIIFDRCDIHGLDFPARLGRGLYLNGSNVAVIDSRVHKITRWGESNSYNLEAAAIDISDGPGPGRIENNLLEAIGVTLFFPDASRHRLPPADYVVRRNYFSHPEDYLPESSKNWSGKNYNNRQIVELKAGQRVLIEGNIFDGNWSDVTQGAMVLLTPRATSTIAAKKIASIENGILRVVDNAASEPYTPGLLVSVQATGSSLDGIWEIAEVLSPVTFRLANAPSGTATGGQVVAVTSHMQISDIDIRSNIFRKVPNLLWMNGHDVGTTTKTTQRVRFHNNLVVGIDCRPAREGGLVSPIGANREGRAGIAVFAAFGMEDLIVTNNTIFDVKGKAPTLFFFDSAKYGAHAGLLVRDNIIIGEKPTVASISGTFPGTEALNRQWTAHPQPKWTFRNNVLCCDIKTKEPEDNMWPDKASDIGLANPLAGAYQLLSGNRYAGTGNAIGVNFPELEGALADSLDKLRELLISTSNTAAREGSRGRKQPRTKDVPSPRDHDGN